MYIPSELFKNKSNTQKVHEILDKIDGGCFPQFDEMTFEEAVEEVASIGENCIADFLRKIK